MNDLNVRMGRRMGGVRDETARPITSQHQCCLCLLLATGELTESSVLMVRTDHSGGCEAAPSQQHNASCMSHWHKTGIIKGRITTTSEMYKQISG